MEAPEGAVQPVRGHLVGTAIVRGWEDTRSAADAAEAEEPADDADELCSRVVAVEGDAEEPAARGGDYANEAILVSQSSQS